MKPKLPTSLSKAWPGGFALRAPNTAYQVSAAKGSVLAAGADLWMMPPGATGFLKGPLPDEIGDTRAVAVEPRRPSRFAISGFDCVSFIDRGQLSTLSFDRSWGEPSSMAWGRNPQGQSALWVLFNAGQLVRIVPESDMIELVKEDVRDMATDENGALVFAHFNEEDWDVEICLELRQTNQTIARWIPAPDCMSLMTMAIADVAVAVSFWDGLTYIARDWNAPFVEVKGLRGGAPLAFQGCGKDAALFGIAGDEDGGLESIVRIDASGEATCVAELGAEGGTCPRIHQLAWDASLNTLWAAAGQAGIARSTANGKGLPFGVGAPS